jgi:hypothetical protein
MPIICTVRHKNSRTGTRIPLTEFHYRQWDKIGRALENKTAEELGEGAEVDLFESLKSEFPEDNIRRVPKR